MSIDWGSDVTASCTKSKSRNSSLAQISCSKQFEDTGSSCFATCVKGQNISALIMMSVLFPLVLWHCWLGDVRPVEKKVSHQQSQTLLKTYGGCGPTWSNLLKNSQMMMWCGVMMILSLELWHSCREWHGRNKLCQSRPIPVVFFSFPPSSGGSSPTLPHPDNFISIPTKFSYPVPTIIILYWKVMLYGSAFNTIWLDIWQD